MGLLLQHLLVLFIVAYCVRFVSCQVMRSLGGKKKGLGGCAGCSGCAEKGVEKEKCGERAGSEPVVFFPVGNLRVNKRLAK